VSAVPIIDLYVIDPQAQVILCDDHATNPTPRSSALLTCIALCRQSIRSGARKCLCCDLPSVTTSGVTYCVALDGEQARWGFACWGCSRKLMPDEIHANASESLSNMLIGETLAARPGGGMHLVRGGRA
jgi:hypothetical protein